jgi:quercetin dioxygenase-like cupin family protein
MKKMTRRGVCTALPAVAALVAVMAHDLDAQTPSAVASTPHDAQPVSRGGSGSGEAVASISALDEGTMGAARAISFDQMPVRAMANGGEGRSIAHGTLATGETVSLRQSMQPAGATPLALHAIQHTEFILVREGELEFQHEVAGEVVAEKVGAGGVIYIAFGTRHAIKNVGDGPARYFVVAVGGDTK